MTVEPITKAVSNRICDHMNRDHNDSILKYVIHYSEIKEPKVVRMLGINSSCMTIEVDGAKIDIPFEDTLLDSKDAHRTLVKMLKDISN